MAKTNLQRNTSYYERMIEEAKKSSHAPHYGEVCTVLKDLAVLIVKFENKFPGILEECKKMLELEKPAMQKQNNRNRKWKNREWKENKRGIYGKQIKIKTI